LIDNTLGQIPGLVTIGEGWYVWRRGMLNNCYCGCSRRFEQCEFWNAVFREAFGEADRKDLKMMFDIFRPLSFYQLGMYFGIHSKKLKEAKKNIEKLYLAIAKVSGCNMIVDSSKWASYGRLLSDIPAFDVRNIHIVRDPRAVTFSWKRKKKYEPLADSDFYYKQYSVFRSTFEWIIWNSSIEVLKKPFKQKYHPLRYEDFVKLPQKEIQEILRFAGEGERKVKMKRNRIMPMNNHCIAGSSLRFNSGDIEIKLDNQWQDDMSRMGKLIVTILTLPFLWLYRYKL